MLRPLNWRSSVAFLEWRIGECKCSAELGVLTWLQRLQIRMDFRVGVPAGSSETGLWKATATCWGDPEVIQMGIVRISTEKPSRQHATVTARASVLIRPTNR